MRASPAPDFSEILAGARVHQRQLGLLNEEKQRIGLLNSSGVGARSENHTPHSSSRMSVRSSDQLIERHLSLPSSTSPAVAQHRFVSHALQLLHDVDRNIESVPIDQRLFRQGLRTLPGDPLIDNKRREVGAQL